MKFPAMLRILRNAQKGREGYRLNPVYTLYPLYPVYPLYTTLSACC